MRNLMLLILNNLKVTFRKKRQYCNIYYFTPGWSTALTADVRKFIGRPFENRLHR